MPTFPSKRLTQLLCLGITKSLKCLYIIYPRDEAVCKSQLLSYPNEKPFTHKSIIENSFTNVSIYPLLSHIAYDRWKLISFFNNFLICGFFLQKKWRNQQCQTTDTYRARLDRKCHTGRALLETHLGFRRFMLPQRGMYCKFRFKFSFQSYLTSHVRHRIFYTHRCYTKKD